MTKLCNTCEYLKFCARSGIEEVGCDRYQKDTTTNEEWLKSCNTEQLAEFLLEFRFDNNVHNPLCNYLKRNFNGTQKLEMLVVEWLKQPHKDTK